MADGEPHLAAPCDTGRPPFLGSLALVRWRDASEAAGLFRTGEGLEMQK